jgi:hypothetical protein
MSLEHDGLCLPVDYPRHKLRAYGRVIRTPGGAEYRRLLNFLSKSASQGERAILDTTSVPKFAQVPSIVNRRFRSNSAQEPTRHTITVPQTQTNFEPARKSFARPDSEFDPNQTNFDPCDFAAGRELEELPFSITIDESLAQYVPAIQHVQTIQHFEFEQAANSSQFSVECLEGAPDAGLAQLMAKVQQQNEVHPSDRAAELIAQNPAVEKEDGEFLSHLALLLNEWFDRESLEQAEEAEDEPQEDVHAKRREALLRNHRSKKESEQKIDFNSNGNLAISANVRDMRESDGRGVKEIVAEKEAELRRRSKDPRKQALTHTIVPMPNGMRREVYRDGSFIVKDAVGRVTEAWAADGATVSCNYDEKGHFKSFVRSDAKGKICTTGVKDRHGVVVADENNAVRAQGDSMTVDSNGCISIRKFDGQFWSLDVMRGIHIERRILEDANGNWNSLTALLTSDGFRMVTRFQRLQETRRENYRRYGDWLASSESSKFRFYGRDGSMIQFDSDEDLAGLRPSRIWPAGSRPVEREWIGRRQAGTAWEAVHRYIAEYLSAL